MSDNGTHNGVPLRIEADESGSHANELHLSYVMRKAIDGFWKRRGFDKEPERLTTFMHDRRKNK